MYTQRNSPPCDAASVHFGPTIRMTGILNNTFGGGLVQSNYIYGGLARVVNSLTMSSSALFCGDEDHVSPDTVTYGPA